MRSLLVLAVLGACGIVRSTDLSVVYRKSVVTAELYTRSLGSSVTGFGFDFGSGIGTDGSGSSGTDGSWGSWSSSSSGSSSSSSSGSSSSSSGSGSSSSGSSSSSSSSSSSNSSVVVGKREWRYHYGVVVTTYDNERWLIYNTNDFGHPMDTAIVEASRMSSAWTRAKCGIVELQTVRAFMDAGRISCTYSMLSCNDKMASAAMWNLVVERRC